MIKKVYSKVRTRFKSKELFPENEELLRLFGSKNKGYILGTSESILKFDLTALEKDALKISVGNFYEHADIEKIRPSIHIFAASHPPITPKVLRNWWSRCHEVLPLKVPILVALEDREVALQSFPGRAVYFYKYGGDFPIDFRTKILAPWSVSVLVVQLSLFLRTKQTFLLGVDHDWRHMKPYQHFYSHEEPCLEYYLYKEGLYKSLKTPTKMNIPPKSSLYKFYELYQQHEQLRTYSEEIGLKVYNGDLSSIFDVYDKKDYTPF